MTVLTVPPLNDVLQAVNDLRAEHGLGAPLTEMPKGEPGKLCACPLAVALGGATVTSTHAYFPPTDLLLELPSVLDDFVTAFDQGAYPGLVA